MDAPELKHDKFIEIRRQEECPSLKGITYVEYAGASLYTKSQVNAYQQDLLENLYGNPHSSSPSSRLATDAVDQVRFRILQFFNADPDTYSVIFTSGCTAGLKIVAESFSFKPCQENNPNNDAERNNTQVSRNDMDNKEACKEKGNSENSSRNFGCYAYLLDNHTSVQGMREIVADRVGKVVCVDEENNDIHMINTLSASLTYSNKGNNLFVFPGQSNFSGKKYPSEWVQKVHNCKMGFQAEHQGDWFVCLDAASLVSTSPLDLSQNLPDFVALSFYKIFGFPTGLGALLVKNSSAHVLKKIYFGGGTVGASSATDRFHVFRKSIHERFEDGTLPYLEIIALHYGFNALNRIGGGIRVISAHTFAIAKFFYCHLGSLQHFNGQKLAEIYSDTDFQDTSSQGPIITFNLIRSNGQYIGFAEVDKLAQLHDIHLRTGCFCNIGACGKFLHMSSKVIQDNFQAGHQCGDNKDLINGRPTGAVRISFGYLSTLSDAQHCLKFIVKCFLEGSREQETFFSAEEFSDPTKVSSICNDNIHLPVSRNPCLENLNPKQVLENDKQMPYSVEKFSKEIGKLWLSTAEVEKGALSELCSDTKKDNFDEQENSICRLTDIFLYPVKSCGAFRVEKWPTSDRGLLYDREWMIVSSRGVALSQKRETNLCLVRPSIDLKERTLTLKYPGVDDFCLYLDTATTATHCTSRVCGDRVNWIDCGEEAADWISDCLQRPGCRLVRQNQEDKRCSKLHDVKLGTSNDSERDDTSALSLANESQYLLISRTSVQLLQQQIQQKYHGDCQTSSVDFDLCQDTENLIGRFRGNLIIDGLQPLEEDVCNEIKIGNHHFYSQGGCSRCQMVCVDQDTGQRGPEPLKTLAVWRGRKIPFGIHLRMNQSQPAVLQVDDPVTLL